jgi:hypothetical protein
VASVVGQGGTAAATAEGVTTRVTAATAVVETNVRNQNYIHSDWFFYPLVTKPSQQFFFRCLLNQVIKGHVLFWK